MLERRVEKKKTEQEKKTKQKKTKEGKPIISSTNFDNIFDE